MRPIIGVSGNYNYDNRSFCLTDYYVNSLRQAGAKVVILPPTEDSGEINTYLEICHGFVLSGGGDLDPRHWGELPALELGTVNPLRDVFELQLARQIMSHDLPVLGICRGCQVLNVAAGGTLEQHINSGMLHDQNAPRSYPFHDILVGKESMLRRTFGSRESKVNSFHHQAVKKPGIGLNITAWAPDGVVEAIESSEHKWVVGVQWHPECMTDEPSRRIFRCLVDACLKYSNSTQQNTKQLDPERKGR